jgi:RNA polymerase sigma-70 factor, ECF subfamily
MSAPTTTRSRAHDPVSDQRLAAAVRQGEQQAAAQLVERHGAGLARFLYSSGAELEQLEDLVQETFFRAFRRLHTWRGEASFRSWLFRIGSNLVKDQHRGRKGRQLVSLKDHEIASTTDPHAEVEADELSERLRRAITRLPRLQREVFLLRAQEGSSYDEIAAALKTTAGAARVHYHQAVKRLKELIR